MRTPLTGPFLQSPADGIASLAFVLDSTMGIVTFLHVSDKTVANCEVSEVGPPAPRSVPSACVPWPA